jgi:long-chain acyl-CoA synthetase
VRALLQQAEECPDKTVLVAGQDKWSSKRLAERAGRLAAGLADRDVRPGDRVALHMHNTAEATLAHLACLRLGAVAVPLNTRLAAPELHNLVSRVRPKIYLGQDNLYPQFAPVPEGLVPQEARFLSGPAEAADTEPWPGLDADDAGLAHPESDPDTPALLLATSGTTGESKIAVWTRRTLDALGLSAEGRGIGRGDVITVMVPLMHTAGT